MLLVEGLAPGVRGEGEIARTIEKSFESFGKRNGQPQRPYASVEEAAERVRASREGLSMEAAMLLASRGTRVEKSTGKTYFSHDPRLRATSSIYMSPAQSIGMVEAIKCPAAFIHIGHQPWYPPELAKKWEDIIRQKGPVIQMNGHHHLHMEPDGAQAIASFAKRWLRGVESKL